MKLHSNDRPRHDADWVVGSTLILIFSIAASAWLYVDSPGSSSVTCSQCEMHWNNWVPPMAQL